MLEDLTRSAAMSRGLKGLDAVVAANVDKNMSVDCEQPLSLVITNDENRILRIPNQEMSSKQQKNLEGMLTDIKFDPEGFKKCVEERRKQAPLVSSRSVNTDCSMATESLCSDQTDGAYTGRTDLSESGEVPAPIQSPVIRQGSINDYKVSKTIGKGKFSVVYFAERKEDNHPCALKKVELPSADTDGNSKLMKEVRLLQGLSHPNIVSRICRFARLRIHLF